MENMVYEALESIVGFENIERDAAITEVYSSASITCGMMAAKMAPLLRPEAVVLPQDTKEVQEIVKCCNRYRIKYIIVGSNKLPTTIPTQPGTILVDPKRMDEVIIDEKNMYAVVGPFTNYAVLQAEAMKKGLYSFCPLGGSNFSVIANHLFQGFGFSGHKFGFTPKGILGAEWVTPTGEVVRVGSFGQGEEFFWGEGPGPDLRGILRGSYGPVGGMGIVTRMAIKLHAWPGPRTLPCSGVSPRYRQEFPEFKDFVIRFPDRKKMIDAMYEIASAGIGGAVYHLPNFFIVWEVTTSKQELYDEWESGFWQRECKNNVVVWLLPYASSKQVEYEEKVLREIVEEYDGDWAPEEVYERLSCINAETFRAGTVYRLYRPSGTFLGDAVGGSFDTAERACRVMDKIKDPIIERGDSPEDDHSDWICSYEFGFQSHGEVEYYPEYNDKGAMACIEFVDETIKACTDTKEILPYIGLLFVPPARVGPGLYNYDRWMRKIKKAFDPNNLSNPPQPMLEGEEVKTE